MQNISQINNAHLSGQITEPFMLNHTSHGVNIFSTKIKVKRLSGCFDVIPVMVPEYVLYGDWRVNNPVGMFASAWGSIRSFNAKTDGRTRVNIFVYVDNITLNARSIWRNYISFYGYLCKPPTYRRTPRNARICDTMLVVNREHGKRSYIPAICWDELAENASRCSVGDLISLGGRIQSREYTKRFPDGTAKQRVCYEVSAESFLVVKDTKKIGVRI